MVKQVTALFNRRTFLGTASSAAVLAALPRTGRAAAPRTALTVGTRTIDVGGKAATVFGITDANGKHGLTLDRAERFDVRLSNETGEPTIIHWHGLTPPFALDGNTVAQAPIPPGGSQDYAFDLDRAGTNWMHSHVGLQEAQLMAAPLIVRDGPPDRQEVVMILHDFSFTPPEEILSRLAGGEAGHVGSGMAGMQMGTSMQGNASGGMAGMDHSAMPMAGMEGGAMPMGEMQMDLNDVAFDAYLANDRDLRDPEIVRVDRNAPVRVRIINAASSSNFWIDLGSTVGTLRAVDGMDVSPLIGRRFAIAMAQRLDIEIAVPDATVVLPILAQREGDRARTGLVLATQGARIARIAAEAERTSAPLALALERRLAAAELLPARAPDRAISCDLTGGMDGYVWGIDGATFEDRTPLTVAAGERVEITMRNRTMMSHPMHLHGHHFQVVGLGRARLAGAMRDTVLVPPMDSVTIAFDAANPGEWPLHCHNLFHMEAGMMTTVRYA